MVQRMAGTTTFNCDLCGKERTERTCWYKKREFHYCSRQCANTANARKKATGLSRQEYEKLYWSKPENNDRRKIMSKEAYRRRKATMGESFIKTMLARCRARALIRGLEFDLEVSDIVMPSHCPVLGMKFEVGDRQGGLPNSPSLDRIDSSKGYTRGNIQVISKRANSIKSDASPEEIRLVYQWVSSCQPASQQLTGQQTTENEQIHA